MGLCWPTSVLAGPDDAVIYPTIVSEGGKLRKKSGDEATARRAAELDSVISDAAQDLGLTVEITDRPDVDPSGIGEETLVRRARDTWVVSPRLERLGGDLRIRIVVVPPGSAVALSRAQRVKPAKLDVTTLRMMRDLVEVGRGNKSEIAPEPETAPTVVRRSRSPGRAILALSSATLGGYLGFTIERVSESDDERVLFPLVALGTGLGLGASMLAADEWSVSIGDAWYVTAGTWWGAASGILVARGYNTDTGDRYAIGLGGAAAGLTLATVSLSFVGNMSEGGAVLTHSGGAFGMLLGGVTEMSVRGETGFTPNRGMGIGAGAGLVLFGTLATQADLTSSRVLLIDLSATLGALAGAAVGSPLVIDDEPSDARVRGWMGAIATGTLGGALVGTLVTRPERKQAGFWAMPSAGAVALSRAKDGRTAPAYGLSLRGGW